MGKEDVPRCHVVGELTKVDMCIGCFRGIALADIGSRCGAPLSVDCQGLASFVETDVRSKIGAEYEHQK